MPVTAAEARAYVRKLDAAAKAASKIEDQARREVWKIVNVHRQRIADAMNRAMLNDGSISRRELPAIRDTIRHEMNAMQDELQHVTLDAQNEANRVIVQEAQIAAAGIDASTFFSPSTDIVAIAQTFTADFVRSIEAQFMPQINAVLSRTALGGMSPWDAMKKIDALIGNNGASGVSFQAERIVRTEVGRIYSVSFDAQVQNAMRFANNPDAVKKTWVSGPMRPGRREEHQQMDGTTIPYNDPFITPIYGDMIMYPRDPGAEPRQTIMCGCGLILDSASMVEAFAD